MCQDVARSSAIIHGAHPFAYSKEDSVMKHIGWLCGAVAATVVCAGIVRAQGDAGGSDAGGAKAGKGELRDEIKGYFEHQKEENASFRSELEGITNLDQKISAIIENRDKQYQENK